MDTMMPANNQPNAFERAARWLGDLDHPFYQDERHRAVWYEASAIGFQVALVGSYMIGSVVVLTTGQVGLVVAMMLPAVVASMMVMSWTARKQAEYGPAVSDLRRSRGAAVAVVAVLFVLAILVRGLIDDEAMTIVMSGGALAGLVAAMVGGRATRRRLEAEAAAPDED